VTAGRTIREHGEGEISMRIKQIPGTKGSLKWIQRLAEHHSGLFETELGAKGLLAKGDTLTWISPLASDEWAEYRDAAFLDRIGCHSLAGKLAAFWPSRGPQWDGLARDSSGQIFIIEAKAHRQELASSCQAGEASLKKISAALEQTKAALGANPAADWLNGHYQYANRLALLRFLLDNDVKAHLVFLYFTNDAAMGGPRSPAEWEESTAVVKRHLGLPQDASASKALSISTLIRLR
jgi:hypothetical protein